MFFNFKQNQQVEKIFLITSAILIASALLWGALAIYQELSYVWGTPAEPVSEDRNTQKESLVFSESRPWQIAADAAIATYTETFNTWSSSSADTWEDKDLSGYGVPANAVVEVAVLNSAAAANYYGGVRANGSALNRYIEINEAEGGGGSAYNALVMHVQADASSIIEAYADDTTSVTFALLGYWSGGTYVEKAGGPFAAGADAAWQDADLSGQGVSANNIVEIIGENRALLVANDIGVRTNGSSLARIVNVHEAEGGGATAGNTVTFLAKAVEMAGGVTIEVYAGTNATVRFFLAGYWSSAPTAYTELFQDLGQHTGSDLTWADLDLSSYVPANSIADFILGHEAAGTQEEMGVRANGSSLSRYILLDEAEPEGGNMAGMHVQTDASSIVDWIHGDVSDAHSFYLIGYWGNNRPTGTFNSAAQKTDGSGAVDISIDAADLDSDDSKAKLEYKSGADCSSGTSDPTLDEATGATASLAPAPDVENDNTYQVGTTTPILTSSTNTVTFDWLSATDQGSANGTYCLKLTVNDGTADQTTPATTTLTLDNVDPAGLTALSCDDTTQNAATLSWTAVTETNFDHYEIWYDDAATIDRSASDTEWDNDDDANLATKTTATTQITGLGASVTYYFKIWAVDDYGNEETVAETSCTTSNNPEAVQFSVSSWIKPYTTAASRAFVIKDLAIRLASNAASQVLCQIHNGTAWQTAAVSNSALSLGEWQQIGCTYDQANIKVYINGRQNGSSQAETDNVDENGYNFRLGSDQGGTYSDFGGYLDEVRIYQYARTAAQMKAEYQAGASRGSGAKIAAVQEKQDVSEGLVGWWKLDESAGNAADSSGAGTTLTNVATATYTLDGHYARSASLDGSTQYFYAADNATLSLTGSLTLAAWIYPDKITGSQDIAGKWDNDGSSPAPESYLLALEDNNLRLYIDSAANYQATTGTPIAATGTWYFVAGVYDAGQQKVRLYVNGREQASATTGTIPASLGDDAGRFHLGAEDSSTSAANFFAGLIDDVKLYKTARAADQIWTDWETGPPPVLHFKMDERINTSGGAINDSEGPNNGILTDSGNTGITCQRLGKYGGACEFDGSDDYIDVTDDDSLSFGDGSNDGSFTIGAWVYMHDATSFQIASKGGLALRREYVFYTDTSDSLAVARYDQSTGGYIITTSNIALTAFENLWIYLTAVYNGSAIKLYLNGRELGVTNAGVGSYTAMESLGANFAVGRSLVGGTLYANGLIDDLRVYNYVRGPKQIWQDMLGRSSLLGGAGGADQIEAGAIAYWNFNEGVGLTANDRSGHNNSLILSASAWTLDGKFGSAWNGDGSVYLTRTDDADFDFAAADDFTIAGWIRHNTISSTSDYIVTKHESGTAGGYKVYLDADGDLAFAIDDDGTWNSEDVVGDDQSKNYDDNTWHHFTAVKQGTTRIDLFVDSILIDSDISLIADGTLANAADLYVGIDADGASDAFDGELDEIKFYPFLLSPAEIKQEYNQGRAMVWSARGTTAAGVPDNSAERTYCPPGDSTAACGPIAHWKFDEGSWSGNGAVLDITGNQNRLTHQVDAHVTSGGKHGRAAVFDGTSDSLCSDVNIDGTCDDDNDFDFGTGSFTITGWFKHSVAVEQDTILTKFQGNVFGDASGGYSITMANDGDIFFRIDNGEPPVGFDAVTSTTADYDDNSWHYFAAVKDGVAAIHLYLDGVKVDSDNSLEATNSLSNSINLYIGVITPPIGGPFGDLQEWTGFLDDVRVYNYAQSAGQITWDYNQGKPVSNWKMDSVGYTTPATSDLTIFDYSEQSNDGTLKTGAVTLGHGTISGALWKIGRDCQSGSCLEFASNRSVNLGTSSSLQPSNITISFWVKRTANWSATNQPMVWAKYSISATGWSVGVGNLPGALYLSVDGYNGFYVSGDPNDYHPLNEWVHIVATFNSSTNAGAIYKNGLSQTVSTFDTPDTISGDSYSKYLGYDADESYLWGSLDEIRIYNTVLSAVQIYALYNNNDRTGGASLEDNLVAEWRLDERSGSYALDTNYQRVGKRGLAMKFDGSNDYITRTDDSDFDFGAVEGFTITGWFKHDTASTNDYILTKYESGTAGGYKVYMDADGDIAFAIDDDGTWDPEDVVGDDQSKNYDDNGWHHFAAAKNGTTGIYIYVDGLQIDNDISLTATGSLANAANLYIGINSDGSTGPFNGLLDEIKIYRYLLTDDQLKTDYNEGAFRLGSASGLP